MKKTFKCCWNCSNGFTAACQSREETERFRATKRFCCASYPVSSHAENPYKQRYCKQFEIPMFGIRFGHEISKLEAQKLNTMTAAELVQYWKIQTSWKLTFKKTPLPKYFRGCGWNSEWMLKGWKPLIYLAFWENPSTFKMVHIFNSNKKEKIYSKKKSI